ncbi:hypothetical protein KFS98_003697 [Salmonella enterica]|nr:hypothetical protein [Salmonella enterica]
MKLSTITAAILEAAPSYKSPFQAFKRDSFSKDMTKKSIDALEDDLNKYASTRPQWATNFGKRILQYYKIYHSKVLDSFAKNVSDLDAAFRKNNKADFIKAMGNLDSMIARYDVMGMLGQLNSSDTQGLNDHSVLAYDLLIDGLNNILKVQHTAKDCLNDLDQPAPPVMPAGNVWSTINDPKYRKLAEFCMKHVDLEHTNYPEGIDPSRASYIACTALRNGSRIVVVGYNGALFILDAEEHGLNSWGTDVQEAFINTDAIRVSKYLRSMFDNSDDPALRKAKVPSASDLKALLR